MKRALLVLLASALAVPAQASTKLLFAIRGYSNQALTVIDLSSGEVRDSVAAIGPGANALVVRGNKLYIVNSGGSFVGLNASIVVYNIADIINLSHPAPAASIAVPDFKNPYDIVFVSDTKAYVSCLLDSSVLVLDAQNNVLGKRIQVGPGPEGLAVAGGKVYVANAYDPSTFAFGNTVSVISSAADTLLRTITTYTNPQSIELDNLGRPNVVSTGSYDSTGRVTVLNPTVDTAIAVVQMHADIGNVVFTSADIGYTCGLSGGILSYNAATFDTIRTGFHPSPVAGGTLAIDHDTLYVARTGMLGIYAAETLDSLTQFSLKPRTTYPVLAVYTGQMTANAKEQQRPSGFALEQNFPNPFNPSTTIRFRIPNAGYVSLRVFDVIGREVATLVDGELHAGLHEVTWDAGNAASGVYLCQLQTHGSRGVSRLLLVR